MRGCVRLEGLGNGAGRLRGSENRVAGDDQTAAWGRGEVPRKVMKNEEVDAYVLGERSWVSSLVRLVAEELRDPTI